MVAASPERTDEIADVEVEEVRRMLEGYYPALPSGTWLICSLGMKRVMMAWDALEEIARQPLNWSFQVQVLGETGQSDALGAFESQCVARELEMAGSVEQALLGVGNQA